MGKKRRGLERAVNELPRGFLLCSLLGPHQDFQRMAWIQKRADQRGVHPAAQGSPVVDQSWIFVLGLCRKSSPAKHFSWRPGQKPILEPWPSGLHPERVG